MPKKIFAATLVALLAVSTLFAQDIRRGMTNVAFLSLSARSRIRSTVDGWVALTNAAETIGVLFKLDALPSVGTCGTGAAVAALSTPYSGTLSVGTTVPAACTVNFNGTAFTNTPNCTANVKSTTAAEARAIATSASTTVLTLTPSAAFADSSAVTWECPAPK